MTSSATANVRQKFLVKMYIPPARASESTGIPMSRVCKAPMVLDIAGHPGDVEDDVDVGKIGSNDGCNCSARGPFVNAGSRDGQTDKSVGGIEH